MRAFHHRTLRLLGSAALVVTLAASLGGCVTDRLSDTTGSIGRATPVSAQDWRRQAESLGQRYRANPHDPAVALQYAHALRMDGQRTQAAAVLEQISILHPHDRQVLGAYGRALADVGRYQQALEVLGRAHTPDQPDWRILSAQGAVLDEMGKHKQAQRYYASALRIRPDEPSVLSNLGLSYALSKQLPLAEQTLRRAAARQPVDPRVRQNLALVVGLQGHFAEAESIARADLPPDEAAANAAYLRQMLASHAPERTGEPRSQTAARQHPLAQERPRGRQSAMAPLTLTELRE